MAYQPPSANFTQVQESNSVNAVLSDLMSGIVGPAFNVVELGDYTYPYATISGAGTSFTVAASGIDSTTQEVDANSIYAEFISEVGETVPWNGTIALAGTTLTFSVSTGTIGDALPRTKNSSNNKYKARIAFRALYKNRNREVLVSSYEDILYSAGKMSSLNPLGFAAGIMSQNTAASFSVYAIAGSGQSQSDWQSALDAMDNSSVYALAPLTNDKTNYFTLFKTWVANRSLPVNSRPTKLYFSPYITWNDGLGDKSEKQLSVVPKDASNADLTDTVYDLSLYRILKTGKKNTAENIAAQSANSGFNRVTFVHPDMGWLTETRHVLQCKSTYVSKTSGVSGGKAKLATRLTLADGTIYQAGTILTDTIITKLVGTTTKNGTTVPQLTDYNISVEIPVPGYYLAVQQAALVSAIAPSEPKTKQPVGGITKIDLSENFFGTEYTNIIAGGGTNVIIQPTLSVLPYSRHHLTTDMTTIESREDSILHQIDAVTINYKAVLQAMAGKYKQDAKFYKMLRATLMAYAEEFKKKSFAKDIQILEVKQSPDQPDHVLVVLRVLCYYADNYIDVTVYY